MIRLSVNINKIATLRNARGGNVPDVQKAAVDCERFGAQGITVHPRPDERHIRYNDVYLLKKLVTTEFNVEGYPDENFMKLVLSVIPQQVTLVPDSPEVKTSNVGWDVRHHTAFLRDIIARLRASGIRTSVFVNADRDNILRTADTGADRVELFTEPYALGYPHDPSGAVAPFIKAAEAASEAGLGLNAGHDLSLENLNYFALKVPGLLEVSIGHALISDALYFGLENTIQMYRRQLMS